MRTHPDSPARFWASAALVACAVTLVLIGASGCKEAWAYIALGCIAAFAVFVLATCDA
jgi:hypothetical protein